MYSHLIATLFLTLPAIHGGPLPTNQPARSFSVIFKTGGHDANHKCAYLRRTKLVTPEPDFIGQCTTLEEATAIKHLSRTNELNALCLLYFINFQRLCHVTNRLSDTDSPLLSDAVISKGVEGSQSNLLEVCDVIKSNLLDEAEFQPGITVIKDAFEKGKCRAMCADLDDTVLPVCSTTAFMIHTAKKLLVSLAPAESKTERGAASKPKPHYTEHIGEVNSDNTHNQPGSAMESKNLGSPVEAKHAEENQENLNPAADNGVKSPEESAPVAHISKETEVGAVQQPSQAQPPEPPSQPQQPAEPQPRENSEIKSTNTRPEVDDQQAHDHETGANYAIQGNTGQTLEIPVKSEESLGNTVAKAEDDNGNKQAAEPMPQTAQHPQEPPKDAEKKDESEAGAAPVLPDDDKTKTKVESAQKDQPSGEHVDVKPNVPSKVDGGAVDAVGDNPSELKDVLEQEDADDDAEVGPGNDGDVDYANINDIQPQPKSSEVKPKPVEKPLEIDEDSSSFSVNYQNQNIDDSESYFFSYFMMVCIMFICGYVAYHNKQKILALVVEGRKGRRPSRTRRPNSANYRKLDSNLEEAVTSSCNKNATQVIY